MSNRIDLPTDIAQATPLYVRREEILSHLQEHYFCLVDCLEFKVRVVCLPAARFRAVFYTDSLHSDTAATAYVLANTPMMRLAGRGDGGCDGSQRADVGP